MKISIAVKEKVRKRSAKTRIVSTKKFREKNKEKLRKREKMSEKGFIAQSVNVPCEVLTNSKK